MLTYSNMAKFSLSFKSPGNGCTPPILIKKSQNACNYFSDIDRVLILEETSRLGVAALSDER